MGFPLPLLPRASGLDSWSCFLSQPPAKPESFAPPPPPGLIGIILYFFGNPWRLLTQEGRGGLCLWVSPASASSFDSTYILIFWVSGGEEEESEQSQAQRPIQSSIYPGLPHGLW